MHSAKTPSTRPGLTAGLVLLAVLLAVDGMAIWSIFSARRGAREIARQDLELQTRVHARSLEALLANLRADLLFLAQSPPLQRHLEQSRSDARSDDPMARRWSRLDAESTLLLFLQANPATARVAVRPTDDGEDGKDDPFRLVAGRAAGRRAAGRRESPAGGAPLLLPAGAPPPADPDLLRGSWPVGSTGSAGGTGWRLEAWVDPSRLLAVATPGLEGRLRLVREAPSGGAGDGLRVAVHVDSSAFVGTDEAPRRWLLREEPGSEVLRSVEDLSRRYHTTILVNVAVVVLTLVLAGVALRQGRRAARLEAETRQQVRIRELERQLLHSERLAGVGRLAAGMAHEINNPLEGMSNYLRLLEDDLDDGDLPAARSTAGKLGEGLRRAAAVVRQVLAFSDPGKAPKERVDLREVVEETLDFVASNPAFRQVEIDRRLSAEPVVVRGQATALGQLVLNLLLNACEIQLGDGETSGRVEVELGIVGADDAEDHDAGDDRDAVARLTVADRGPGFAAGALDHVFEPFYSRRESTGLGLSVCHGIVRDHGGEIRAANRDADRNDGPGAVVTVEIPLADSSSLSPPSPQPSPPAGGRGSQSSDEATT